MTLIRVAKAVAKNVGIEVPETIIGNPDRTAVEIRQLANEAGEEIARRVDWGRNVNTATFDGASTSAAFALPAGFSRMQEGVCMMVGTSIVRPMSKAEYLSLPAAIGTPRYFSLTSENLRFWPYLATGLTAKAYYLSNEWCTSGSSVASDDDTFFFGDDLLSAGIIVRWRRQKGMPYEDEEALYEAMLADLARFDGRSRI